MHVHSANWAGTTRSRNRSGARKRNSKPSAVAAPNPTTKPATTYQAPAAGTGARPGGSGRSVTSPASAASAVSAVSSFMAARALASLGSGVVGGGQHQDTDQHADE